MYSKECSRFSTNEGSRKLRIRLRYVDVESDQPQPPLFMATLRIQAGGHDSGVVAEDGRLVKVSDCQEPLEMRVK